MTSGVLNCNICKLRWTPLDSVGLRWTPDKRKSRAGIGLVHLVASTRLADSLTRMKASRKRGKECLPAVLHGLE